MICNIYYYIVSIEGLTFVFHSGSKEDREIVEVVCQDADLLFGHDEIKSSSHYYNYNELHFVSKTLQHVGINRVFNYFESPQDAIKKLFKEIENVNIPIFYYSFFNSQS